MLNLHFKRYRRLHRRIDSCSYRSMFMNLTNDIYSFTGPIYTIADSSCWAKFHYRKICRDTRQA